jgi:hypothetical protein
MISTLITVDCPTGQDNLLESLVRLYGRLGDIVDGRRKFGGFVAPRDLGEKYHMKVENYPRLTMSFSNEDRRSLIGYAGMSAKDLLACAATPLERLAIATLWKQADLGKVRHIAAGFVENESERRTNHAETDAPVFRQFGRHLSNPASQPIVDQHTLRAYRYQQEENIYDSRHRLNTVKAQEVKEYAAWVRVLANREPSLGKTDRMYEFDQSMFALGKATKAFIFAVIDMTPRKHKVA